jgi:hypothetical protein
MPTSPLIDGGDYQHEGRPRLLYRHNSRVGIIAITPMSV